jgi:hypothetical protein
MTDTRSEKRTIWDRIDAFDERIAYVILIILIVVPLLSPLGLPLMVDPHAEAIYQMVETIQPGDNVWLINGNGPDSWATYAPGVIVLAEHLFQRGAKIHLFENIPDSAPATAEWAIERTPAYKEGRAVYGENWIHYEYVPGDMYVSREAIAKDIRSVIHLDYREGKNIDDFPIMQGVTGAKDFKLVIEYTSWGGIDQTIAKITQPNNIPFIAGVSIGDLSIYMPSYNAGLITEYFSGTAAYASYEKMLDLPGDALKQTDIYSLTGALSLIGLIIGNIVVLGKRLSGSEGGR